MLLSKLTRGGRLLQCRSYILKSQLGSNCYEGKTIAISPRGELSVKQLPSLESAQRRRFSIVARSRATTLSTSICDAREHFDHVRHVHSITSVASDDASIVGGGGESPPSFAEIKRLLSQKGIGYEDGHACIAIECFLCREMCKKKAKKAATTPTLFINVTTGFATCPHCHWSAEWDRVKQVISSAKKGQLSSELRSEYEELYSKHQEFVGQVNEEYERGSHAIEPSKDDQPPPFEDEINAVLKDLNIQHLNIPLLQRFDVRLSKCKRKLIVPLYGMSGDKMGLRIISKPTSIKKSAVPLETAFPLDNPHRPSRPCLFGWKQFHNRNEIILTASVIDAMTVTASSSSAAALALPHGVTHIPMNLLPMLESFRKITLWFPNGVSDWEAAKACAKKLGENRCHFIRLAEGHQSPLAAQRDGRPLSEFTRQSRPVRHKDITTFTALKHDVYSELVAVEQVAGVKWNRYPALNRLLKGHRRGELTVLTGPTGSGKTTFVSEYSLDLCMQGVNTLWGSFEIRNVRLARMMLQQFAQCSLEKNIDQFDTWANRFEKLPLYFMTFHGQQGVSNVLDTMAHAAYVYDISHVIMDNLQFMMGMSELSKGEDRFHKQDVIVAAFRRFATMHNCHVTLVIHPRKERDSEDLTINSVFGGAKATQEADNVLILQDTRLSSLRGRKFLQVAKNRYTGDLGIMPLEFDKESLSFAKKKPKKTAATSTSTSTTTESQVGGAGSADKSVKSDKHTGSSESSQSSLNTDDSPFPFDGDHPDPLPTDYLENRRAQSVGKRVEFSNAGLALSRNNTVHSVDCDYDDDEIDGSDFRLPVDR